MGQLPEYFEYIRETGRETYMFPFSYDETSQSFTIASKTIHVSDFDPYTFNAHELGIDDEEVPADEIENHALLLPIAGGIIVGPALNEWAAGNASKIWPAVKVMYDSYASFYMNPEDIPFDAGHGHMGFSAHPLRDNQGINLQVLGNCACLGPLGISNIFRDQFEHGYALYELHNADSQAQRTSLYAGLGYVARIATGKEAVQSQLFETA
jgi:hypothetical protein